MEEKRRYNNDGISINTLFFADDDLQFFYNIEKAQRDTERLADISRESELEISKSWNARGAVRR